MERITEKITNFIITTMTIISIILFIFGVLALDSPDTAIPEIALMISLGWCGLMSYCISKGVLIR